MIMIQFPTDPTVGDDFLAENGSTYIWTGAYWSSALAVITGRAEPVFEGGDASPYNSALDNTVEGGVEHTIGAN